MGAEGVHRVRGGWSCVGVTPGGGGEGMGDGGGQGRPVGCKGESGLCLWDGGGSVGQGATDSMPALARPCRQRVLSSSAGDP